jgi:hypothetical protein
MVGGFSPWNKKTICRKTLFNRGEPACGKHVKKERIRSIAVFGENQLFNGMRTLPHGERGFKSSGRFMPDLSVIIKSEFVFGKFFVSLAGRKQTKTLLTALAFWLYVDSSGESGHSILTAKKDRAGGRPVEKRSWKQPDGSRSLPAKKLPTHGPHKTLTLYWGAVYPRHCAR